MWPQAPETYPAALSIRSLNCARPAGVRQCCGDRALVDFCLTHRPSGSTGSFPDRWPPQRAERIGAILFVPPGVTFAGSFAPGRHRSLCCRIDARYFDGRLDGLKGRALAECLDVKSLDVAHDLRRLAREVAQPSFVSQVIREALLVTLCADLVLHLQSIPASPARIAGLSPWRLRLIEERIRSPEPLPKVEELAALCRLSTRQLSRAFKDETGQTLQARIKTAGVARARQMLAAGDLAIGDIAARLGFSSHASFTAAFVRATGSRPKDARDRCDA